MSCAQPPLGLDPEMPGVASVRSALSLQDVNCACTPVGDKVFSSLDIQPPLYCPDPAPAIALSGDVEREARAKSREGNVYEHAQTHDASCLPQVRR